MDVPSTNWKPKQYLYRTTFTILHIKDIFFLLGCCDHSSTFHYVFSSSYAHNHLTASSIDQLQKLWEPWVKLWLIIQWYLSFFHKNIAFPEFLTWLFAYFQPTCRSPMESDCPYNKKQGLVSVAFHEAAVITTHYLVKTHSWDCIV
jgi:hypothetical protein